MTLIVAGIDEGKCWMVGDTAITGGTTTLRERTYQIKTEPLGTHALIAFAGDPDLGRRVSRKARTLTDPSAILDFLVESQIAYPSTEFAVAFNTPPRLFLITDGSVNEVGQLHLGNKSAFEAYQKIRLVERIDHPPSALENVAFGTPGADKVPIKLIDATRAMFKLFATGSDHDVGGWPVPLLLGDSGAYVCSYCYSVTDPIMDNLSTGMVIPHGTAEAGGFSISHSPLQERDGVMVYWHQRQTGHLFIESDVGYDSYAFTGNPSEIKAMAMAQLGREIGIWHGEGPLGVIKLLAVLHDSEGRPRQAIAFDGKSFNYSWAGIISEDAFRAGGNINFGRGGSEAMATIDGHQIELIPQGSSEIKMRVSGHEATEFLLQPAEIDDLIQKLATVRSALDPPVSPKIATGTALVAGLDPSWLIDPSPHQLLEGAYLRLRHPGLGWCSFILPPREAKALGDWLLKLSESAETGTEGTIQQDDVL